MGNMVNSSGEFYSSSAGFSTAPESKYYDSYVYNESHIDHARGKLGDATKETLSNFGLSNGGWYNDYAILPYGNHSWFKRGGGYGDNARVGVLNFYCGDSVVHSFRSVLTAE